MIDDIKSELEIKCEGIVSCADIIALATRDLVTLVSTFLYLHLLFYMLCFPIRLRKYNFNFDFEGKRMENKISDTNGTI